MVPAALVFDLDGTIVDTELVEYDSVRLVWQDHGHRYPVSRYVDVIGTTDSPPWIDELEQALGEALDHDHLTRRQHEYKRALLDETQPRPGIVALIEAAADLGIPLAVASNSPLSWIERRLAHVGLRDHFRALLARDVSSAPKPDPAPYLEACRALGAEPARSVAFEDSSPGVHSAVAAGCFTVACPGPLTAGHDLTRAHRAVATHEHVTIEVLVAWLAGDGRAASQLGSRDGRRA